MVKASHELDLLGQANVDFEERVNIPRLKKERLARLQAEMAKADLGGMLFFDPGAHSLRHGPPVPGDIRDERHVSLRNRAPGR